MLTGIDILTIGRAPRFAIAPGAVLGGVMAVMNMLIGRLHRLHDRTRECQTGTTAELASQALPDRFAHIVYAATAACILASVLLVIVSFIEPIFGVLAGPQVVAPTVGAMFGVAIALGPFLRERTLSARGMRLGSP